MDIDQRYVQTNKALKFLPSKFHWEKLLGDALQKNERVDQGRQGEKQDRGSREWERDERNPQNDGEGRSRLTV